MAAQTSPALAHEEQGSNTADTTVPNKAVPEKEQADFEQAEEGNKVMDASHLPRPEEVIEALGIPNWRELEKKAVRRLDMTLMPALWVLYLFNYLDRASIA